MRVFFASVAAALVSLTALGCTDQRSCGTPLVLSFDGRSPSFVAGAPGWFALGQHRDETTDWPTSRTPWLARDLDRSGTIDGGAELFGSQTRLKSGGLASNGLEALADLDSNGDGVIDDLDDAWDELLVWRDDNTNRRTDAGELTTASAERIVRIELGGRSTSQAPRHHDDCNARGDCVIASGSFTYGADDEAKTGAVYDADLAFHAVDGASGPSGDSDAVCSQ
jgi:hypothetical protein